MTASNPSTETGRIRTLPELQETAGELIGGRLLVSVSNREPFVHTRLSDGSVRVQAPVGGLTMALNAAMQAVGGVWVASATGDADREAADSRGRVAVPPDRPTYDLQRIWLSPDEQEAYYSGFANQALWPLCHNAYVKPIFRRAHWNAYRSVNRKFASQIAAVVGDREAIVFIQDYHFGLLPKMVRQSCPRAVCLHFWHIPWPVPDILRVCPWRKELLAAILGNDLLGFHTPQYAEHFLEAASELPGARQADAQSVEWCGNRTRVDAFPISIDFDRIAAKAKSQACEAAVRLLRNRYGLAGKFVVLGLDRIDYTKGLLERLQAIEHLLSQHPEARGNLVYIQAGAPSRSRIPAYRELNEALDRVAGRINSVYAVGGNGPVVSISQQLQESEVLALYRLADVCVVSSLGDGMNLVAKEFLAARNDGAGHLLLSEFTGAAWELPEADRFNPFATEDLADRLLAMSRRDRNGPVERTRRLREHVREHNIYAWIASILAAAPSARNGV